MSGLNFCGQCREDIDLNKGFLIVQCGKGGKSRKVGISKALLALLEECKKSRGSLLNNSENNPMDRHGIRARLNRIGKKAGVKVHPHALRRAFVTINANKGRPLQMLQIACGHSDIKTIRNYCMTSEQEVIEAMQGWD